VIDKRGGARTPQAGKKTASWQRPPPSVASRSATTLIGHSNHGRARTFPPGGTLNACCTAPREQRAKRARTPQAGKKRHLGEIPRRPRRRLAPRPWFDTKTTDGLERFHRAAPRVRAARHHGNGAPSVVAARSYAPGRKKTASWRDATPSVASSTARPCLGNQTTGGLERFPPGGTLNAYWTAPQYVARQA
jgi:hypothetical protein